MSGIITFTEHEDWCGASYAFRHILTKVMELWPADGSVSFKQMLESGIDDGNNYINLNRSSNEDLETFHAAVKKLWQIASDTGPAFLHDPDAYEPYMRWLAELEEMSRRSVKKPKNEKGTGSNGTSSLAARSCGDGGRARRNVDGVGPGLV